MTEYQNTPQPTLFRVLLIGDSCYDIYHYGDITRISPEAPVPVFDYVNSQTKLGMTSNVLSNLEALGVEVSCKTHFFENKNRYIDIKSNQQLLRVDQKINSSSFNEFNIFNEGSSNYDAVIISDYDKGFLTYSAIEKIISSYKGPIFIDTKKPDLKRFGNCFLKINEVEYKDKVSQAPNLIVTRGGGSVTYRDSVFTPPKVEAHDVCGAGDTFLAALAVGYLKTSCIDKSIPFAMQAAAVTVKHIGVYAPTLKEIYSET